MRTVLTVYEDFIFLSTNITSNFQFGKTKRKKKLFLKHTDSFVGFRKIFAGCTDLQPFISITMWKYHMFFFLMFYERSFPVMNDLVF